MFLPATEAMLTMAPDRRRFMCATTDWAQLKLPVRLTSRMRCQSAGAMASSVCGATMPALLTRKSMPPCVAATRSTAALTASASRTSTWVQP